MPNKLYYHGPGWKMEFPIPIQTPHRHFPVLRSHPKIFPSKSASNRRIKIIGLNIGHMIFIPQPAKRVKFFNSPGTPTDFTFHSQNCSVWLRSFDKLFLFLCKFFLALCNLEYRIKGGENNREGVGKYFDITIIGGLEQSGGGGVEEIENSRFLS